MLREQPVCNFFSFGVAVVKNGEAARAIGDAQDILAFNIVFVDKKRQPGRGSKVISFYDDHGSIFLY